MDTANNIENDLNAGEHADCADQMRYIVQMQRNLAQIDDYAPSEEEIQTILDEFPLLLARAECQLRQAAEIKFDIPFTKH